MYDVEKLNKRGFSVKLSENAQYMSLSDLFNSNGAAAVYTVRAIYKNNKSKYGTQYSIVLDENTIIDVPKHLNGDCENILINAFDEINQNKIGFVLESYHSKKYNRDCFSLVWKNL